MILRKMLNYVIYFAKKTNHLNQFMIDVCEIYEKHDDCFCSYKLRPKNAERFVALPDKTKKRTIPL